MVRTETKLKYIVDCTMKTGQPDYLTGLQIFFVFLGNIEILVVFNSIRANLLNC
jgi:hypothetical protein